MALTKYKLGELIYEIKELNNIDNTSFYGININKEFMPTIAKTDDVNGNKYKIVRKNRFVFSGMQTGRDECIRISMYDKDDIIIVSPAYITFEIKRKDLILAEYLFMFFLSKEKDRLGWFLSDSSIRANLDWDVFCDIEIDLPDISIQQQYVNIYNSMVANQKVYEKGLDDLKLVCDAYIENLKKEYKSEKIGKYLSQKNDKNTENKYKKVMGLSIQKEFIETKADMENVSLLPYLIVKPSWFAYVTVTSRNGEKITLAYNNTDNIFIISSSYIVFKVEELNIILPEYLFMHFNRPEFDRYARFHSWGSARETFTWEDIVDVKIPIPSLEIQNSIADLYSVYLKRKEINNKLKEKIKEICPVLIKGALDEGRKNV